MGSVVSGFGDLKEGNFQQKQLAFMINPQYPDTNNCPFISYSDIDGRSIIVFAAPSLQAIIQRERLVGLLLNVIVKINEGGDSAVAMINLNQSIVADERYYYCQKRRVACLIDGPNFLSAVKPLDLSPLETIKLITSAYHCLKIKFFIYWKKAFDLGVITKDQKLELENCVDLQICSNETGYGDPGHNGMDPIILVDGALIFATRHDLEGLVLVSGDYDLKQLIKLWSGLDNYSLFGHRFVDIVSSTSTFSQHLLGVVNSGPGNIRVKFIEEL